jgi:hypothetical protein
MTDTNVARAENGKFTVPASSGDADVDAISTPDPRANGASDAAGGNGHTQESANAERARRLGWQPEEKFRGPKDKWLDADAFIEKVEGEVPVLRERLRFQDKFIQDQQSKFEARFQKQEEAIQELLGKTREAESRGFTYAHAELEAAMDKAAEEGDVKTYQAAKARLIELGKARAPAEKKLNGAEPKGDGGKKDSLPPSPDLQQWMSDNRWFNPNDPDDEASMYAIHQDTKLSRKSPHLSPGERLAKVKEAVERRFPEQFENTNRRSPAPVSTPSAHGNQRTERKKTKTVADLDDEQKAALAAIKRRDPKFKDEDYLKYLK